MKRPVKPQAPEKPQVPSRTEEKWAPIWSLRWPDDFGNEGYGLEGQMSFQELVEGFPSLLRDKSPSDDIRVRWKGTIYWDEGDLDIVLEKREIVPNERYEEQIHEFEEAMVKYAALQQQYETSLAAWEELNQAFDIYEQTVASKQES